MKEQVRFAEHSPRTALHRDSLEAAVLLILPEVGEFVHVEVHVSRDEQINVAVSIVVGPSRAGAESSACHACFVCDIFEFAVAQVVIQGVSAEASYVNVGETVVVVISDGHAHAPPFAGQPGGLGDVSEFEAVVLVIKRDQGIATRLVAIDGRAVHRDDVESTVVITIDQTHTAAHRFDDVALVWR